MGQDQGGPAIVPDVAVETIGGDQTQQTKLTKSIFEEYTPEKVRILGSPKHPGELVQSAAMATVSLPAPTSKMSRPDSDDGTPDSFL